MKWGRLFKAALACLGLFERPLLFLSKGPWTTKDELSLSFNAAFFLGRLQYIVFSNEWRTSLFGQFRNCNTNSRVWVSALRFVGSDRQFADSSARDVKDGHCYCDPYKSISGIKTFTSHGLANRVSRRSCDIHCSLSVANLSDMKNETTPA